MPVDHNKPIVHGTIIKRRSRWRKCRRENEYLVRLDDGREVWYWEDELEKEGSNEPKAEVSTGD